MPDAREPIPFYDLGVVTRSRRAELIDAFADVLDGGWFVGGPIVNEFEAAFAEAVGTRHCIALGNGLDALRIGLEALGIGPGDEVIVPGFTFYATWLAVLQVGAIPVAVDVRVEDAALDVDAVEAAVTERTRAILPVHLYGIPADVSAVAEIADRHGIVIVEDAAQAHGARIGEVAVGSVGEVGAFSFYPTKNLGALGDAGALVTDRADVAETARSRRSYGQGASKYDHVDTGWNTRMDAIQARILTDALPGLDAANARRRAVARAYLDALAGVEAGVVGATAFDASVWHHCVVRTADRDSFVSTMTAAGIGTDVHYPYHFSDLAPIRAALGGHVPDLPSARRLARSVVSLPIGAWISDAQVERVCDVLRQLPRELFVTP